MYLFSSAMMIVYKSWGGGVEHVVEVAEFELFGFFIFYFVNYYANYNVFIYILSQSQSLVSY